MLCPCCKTDLVIVEIERVELDICTTCHGTWFDRQELRQLFRAAEIESSDDSLESDLEALDGKSTVRRCPRCRLKMEHLRAPGSPDAVDIDRCPKGHGLWFDHGELISILETHLAENFEELAMVKNFLGRFATVKRRNDASAP